MLSLIDDLKNFWTANKESIKEFSSCMLVLIFAAVVYYSFLVLVATTEVGL